MGRYDDAADVKVQQNRPLITERDGTHTILVETIREGSSGKDGFPYIAADCTIQDSDAWEDGTKVTYLIKQSGGKGQRQYYLADVKALVGAMQNFEDYDDVQGSDIEKTTGPEAKGVGAMIIVRVYSKPPNDKGKVFKGATCDHLAAAE